MKTPRRAPPSARQRRAALAAALAGVAAASPGTAQVPAAPDSVRIAGQVVDAVTGEGIPEARVTLSLLVHDPGRVGVAWAGMTGEEGIFVSDRIPWGGYLLRAEALGYGTAEDTVDLRGGREMEARVELQPAPLELPPLVVVSRRETRLERSGFYERRRSGQGYSLTREEIESHRPLRASDIFRRVPGVSLGRSGRQNLPLLRFRGCVADIVLDGVPLQGPVSLDEILSPDDVEAVEVHSAAFMPSRTGTQACGTVMVWTREGSPEGGRRLTLKRALVAAAFVALAILLTR